MIPLRYLNGYLPGYQSFLWALNRLRMDSPPRSEVRSGKGYLNIEGNISKDPSFAKESNLRVVLEFLKDWTDDEEHSFQSSGASKLLPFFVQANKASFTESNLKIVLEALKSQYGAVGLEAL